MELAKLIDHTLLKPTATQAQIKALCDQARTYGFASVCVNPVWVRLAKKQLAGSPVKVCTVIGFPLGAVPTAVKVFEAQTALADGADELDMVLNLGALKGGDFDTVQNDIASVRQVSTGHILKVILETSELSDEEKTKACRLAAAAGADFVKTSTGFSKAGATVHDVTLMRQSIPPGMQVKASGGVRTAENVQAMIEAGAGRIGTSNGVQIIEGK